MNADIIFKQRTDYESSYSEGLKDFIKDLEDRNFEDHQDIQRLSMIVKDKFSMYSDTSLIPVSVAKTILAYEAESGYVLSNFDKKLIMEYSTYLIFKSYKSN